MSGHLGKFFNFGNFCNTIFCLVLDRSFKVFPFTIGGGKIGVSDMLRVPHLLPAALHHLSIIDFLSLFKTYRIYKIFSAPLAGYNRVNHILILI